MVHFFLLLLLFILSPHCNNSNFPTRMTVQFFFLLQGWQWKCMPFIRSLEEKTSSSSVLVASYEAKRHSCLACGQFPFITFIIYTFSHSNNMKDQQCFPTRMSERQWKYMEIYALHKITTHARNLMMSFFKLSTDKMKLEILPEI